MKSKSLALCAAMVAYNIGGLATTVPAWAGEAKATFIDMLKLQPGKTADDAKGYFDIIEPIVAKHGLERSGEMYEVVKQMRGDIDVQLVNVWTVSDPDTTFDGIFNDPTYLDNVELRDSIFDLDSSAMMLMSASK